MDNLQNTLKLEILHVYPGDKAQRTIYKIIYGAISAYSKYGLENTTYARISSEAKVSRTLVIHYFPTSEEIFKNAVKLVRQEMQNYVIQEIKELKDPKEILKNYIKYSIKWAEYYPSNARLWLIFYFKCSTNEEYKALNSELVKMGSKRIAEILKTVNPEIKNTDANELAKKVQIQITGSIISMMSEDLSPSKCIKLCSSAVNDIIKTQL